MVKCNRSSCSEQAVINVTAAYCKDHFIDYFESKAAATIKKYRLINKNDKIVVACSGGKDSTTVLYLLNKWFGNVTALAIDEGIPGYRNVTLEDLRSFCSRNKIPLKVLSYKDAFGFSLHEALKKVSVLPCNICGTLRRYLLNAAAKGFTKIATGHNLDDEAQSIMMNFMKGNLELAARLGPVTGVVMDGKFVPRIKPLYFCHEKEVAAYAFLQNFGIRFNECPHSRISFRAAVRDFLNDLEQQLPGTKQNIINNFLKLLPRLKKKYAAVADIAHCSSCGEPSSNELCKACVYVNSLKESAPTAAAAAAIAKF
ncbi:TIGR00269 family protein [Candidatus Woesearchaeota archaeon]|nr:TIGR00269 family protein [Candidatus Woesearchaeota archaeon]